MKRALAIALACIGIFIVVTVVSVITGYNSLVDTQYDVYEMESDIEIEIAARHVALGGIIDAITGLQEHYVEVYTRITAARGLYDDAVASGDPGDMIAADAAQVQAISDFLAYVVIEDNLDLTVDAAYYDYIDAIQLAEGLIAVARQDYNEAVTTYNTSVRKFPKILYASLLGFPTSFDYWRMGEGDEDIPTINF